MDVITQTGLHVSQEGFSLIFQQGVAFIVLSMLCLVLVGALAYMFRLYVKTQEKNANDKDMMVDKFYQAYVKNTETNAALVEQFKNVLQFKG